uniref:G-protein coupled receptors family 1 profile domain-containing protein n=1 Tax=Laticauda laticaudata TaxID=8630 RepID=A0A8C5WPW4_LATLA
MNSSLANMNATAEDLDYNTTNVFNKYQIISNYSRIPLNGIVIWLLGFQIKRNRFTVLILNVAIADFGFLLSMAIYCTNLYIHVIHGVIPWAIIFSLANIMYINGLFLLTAISIDWCVAVFFPIWHHCSQLKYLSSVVCIFLWIFSSILIGIHYIMQYLFWNLHLVVTAVLCLPLITTSAVILLIKICLQSQQVKRGRLLVMILITLLCFLILTVPLYIYVFITHFLKKKFFDVAELNFLLCPKSIKVVFQRIFREVEGSQELGWHKCRQAGGWEKLTWANWEVSLKMGIAL